MNLNGNPMTDSRQKHVIRSVIVAVLATTAMLVGALAMHSAGAGQTMSVTLPAASAQATQTEQPEHAGGMAAITVAGVAALSVAANAHGELLGCAGCMLGCALMAMSCMVLLVLASLVLLARLPSRYRRLLDAGGHVVHHFRGPPLHIYRPSLTFLSISRR